jgi:hypothetical protein
MKNNKHFNFLNLRLLFVVVGVVCVIISSCGIPIGINSLLSDSTEQSTPLNTTSGKKIFKSLSETCTSYVASAETSLNPLQKEIANPFIGTLFTSFFIFILGSFGRKPSEDHPLYNGTKIPTDLPLFLQCRKLLI